MGAMKRQMEDMCYFWRDGLSITEIANIFKTTTEDVKYTIDTYYNLMMGEEP